ncbi:MAG: methionine biosynthesis protein MetW [Chthoniobacterales bacterium]
MKSPSTCQDNRQYRYEATSFYTRPEYSVIERWIPEHSRIIDLGCGNGSLIQYLITRKNVVAEGIERAASGVDFCMQNGLKARRAEIDVRETYANYGRDVFDFAICNVTLHMVMYPEILIEQMARIAPQLVLSFPNFGHVLNRFELLVTGRMPQPQLFGYQWFNTGQIHQLGLYDFADFCRRCSLEIVHQRHIGRPQPLARVAPSLFSRTSVYLCRKRS